MVVDVPTLGNLLVCAILVASGYTFGVSIAAARGRPQLTPAARAGLLATIALVATAVFLLAYAFQAHDFRIRYVARYSDRSMSPIYLWTALWGGQDGSLLWWTFLLGGYSLAFALWVKRKHLELQPWIYATLSSIFAFFAILMLFAANPFATSFGAAPADGEGLNPLLQNYWMAIHPPALYMGLTGWAVPFAIAVAALMTGRLGEEWILMARRWVLLAWAFLTLGNMLGMFWSYEELGWGGYWAWDPVENASFLPWLLGTAYVHSVMIQERRGSFKVWNVSLLTGTFFFTIFGTFLTRSGLIASVHSFARSDIGIYFVWYMIGLAIFLVTLICWRLPELRSKYLERDDLYTLEGKVPAPRLTAIVLAPLFAYAKLVETVRIHVERWADERAHRALRRPPPEIESPLSREFAFLLNNWILLGIFVFILVMTTLPLLSQAVASQELTVGPVVYNAWLIPVGLVLLLLMGIGPLIAWRKATAKSLARAFVAPTMTAVVVGAAHLATGEWLGFPAVVFSEQIYDTWLGPTLAWVNAPAPMIAVSIAAFVLATVLQEIGRGAEARVRLAKESVPVALVSLIARARRRYGGYIVHVGVVLVYLGFVGAAYDQEREAALRPGGTMEVAGYTFRYERARTTVDSSKRALVAELTVLHGGDEIATVEPAKFVYRSHPDMPTTEVAIRSGPVNDIYVILSTVDPASQRATFRVIVRPLVWWIWFGGAIVLLGVVIAAFPTLREILGARSGVGERTLAAAAAVLLAVGSLAIPGSVAHAQSDSSSSLHAGTVEIRDPVERQLFQRLLCECGDCQRLPLSSCGCGWAENMRAELREALGRGQSVAAIQSDYRARFGAAAIAIPNDEGLGRMMWLAPLMAMVLGLLALFAAARRWSRSAAARAAATSPVAGEAGAEYDKRLEDELRRLDEP